MEQPSREMDARVHQALWPDDEVEFVEAWPGDATWSGWKAYWRCIRNGQLEHLPHYSTNLAAWDGVSDSRGWYWYAEEHYDKVHVRLYDGGPLGKVEMYEASVLGTEIPNRHAAWALGMSRCILQWAERR